MWWPVAFMLMGNPPGFLRDLGFASGPPGNRLAWSLSLVIAVFYAAYAVRNIPLVREHWRAVSLFKLLGILLAVSAALVEEAFFRRLLMDGLQSVFLAIRKVVSIAVGVGDGQQIWWDRGPVIDAEFGRDFVP